MEALALRQGLFDWKVVHLEKSQMGCSSFMVVLEVAGRDLREVRVYVAGVGKELGRVNEQ